MNLTGQRYNKLVAVRYEYTNSARHVYWLWQCDCGNTTLARSDHVLSGKIKSCGCLLYEYIDETGHVYGRLEVIKRMWRENNREWTWLCQCDCGNTLIVRGSALRYGDTKSCGCLRSERLLETNTKHGSSKTARYKNMITRLRRERKRKLDTQWTVEMDQLIRQKFPQCAICGITEEEHQQRYEQVLHLDHVRPLSKGFGLKPGNAVLLCKDCNMAKHAKDLNELDEDIRNILLTKANEFKEYWESLV